MIKRICEVSLTPEEMAREFCAGDDGYQAAFFNAIFQLTLKWERPFCFQLQYLTDNPNLSDGGRSIMEDIGEYSDKQSI